MNSVTEVMNIHKCKIAVIRPVRINKDTEYLISRLDNHKYDDMINSNINIIIVDDGSEQKYASIIRNTCIDNNIGYIRIDSERKLFSLARARNIGAIYSKSDYVFIQDIDLYPYSNFYNDLISQIKIQKMDEDITRHLIISCIYLNSEGVDYLNNGERIRYSSLLNDAILGKKEYIERISCGTSICLLNRDYFLQIGGYHENFEGWGYEDIDLNCRLIRKSKMFPCPRDWSIDKGNFNTILEYSGWKSVYRLYGDITMRHGLVLFHATHPIDKTISGALQSKKNYEFFERNIKELKDANPLIDFNAGNTLVIKKCAFTYNRNISHMYGNVFFFDDFNFVNNQDIYDFIQRKNITRVVFGNPYANESTIEIFNLIKKHNIKYVICERGALPGSFFYDSNGFLFDSSSYSPEKWNRKLTDDEHSELMKYVRKLFSSNNALESQGRIIAPQELKRKLNITGKKVIFVPFQRPEDTAVKFFRRANSYNEFIEIIREVSAKISNEYAILVKRHPLEDEEFDIEGVTYVNDYHINSVLSASDYVLTFTSGVGLLSLAAGKPVITVGNSFYSHPGVSFNADSADEVLLILESGNIEIDKINAFLHYLIFNFYSFGEFKTRQTIYNDKRMTATVDIDAECIIFEGRRINYMHRTSPEYGWDSILFDRYRVSQGIYETNLRNKDINKKNSATLPEKTIKNVPTDKKNRFAKKIRKLIKSPVQFFKDIKWSII